jgi:hypothetical protein
MTDEHTCDDGDQDLKKSDLYSGFFFSGAELAFSAAESGIFIDLNQSVGNSPTFGGCFQM